MEFSASLNKNDDDVLLVDTSKAGEIERKRPAKRKGEEGRTVDAKSKSKPRTNEPPEEDFFDIIDADYMESVLQSSPRGK